MWRPSGNSEGCSGCRVPTGNSLGEAMALAGERAHAPNLEGAGGLVSSLRGDQCAKADKTEWERE